MPVVHDLSTAFPDVAIDWVVEPGFAPLVRRVQGVAGCIECALRRWSRSWWTAETRAAWRRFLTRLCRERYDAVLDLQGLTKSAVIAWLAHGVSYGLANRTDGASHEPPARWLVDHSVEVPARITAVDRSRLLAARALGYAPPCGPPRFGLEVRSPAALSGRPTLVFIHGTSRDDKLWPEDCWIALGRRAVAAGWRLALPHGGDAERARAGRLSTALGGPTVAEVWPSMGLDALLDRLAATQGTVGVDSGLSHVAVALGLPHVQLYNFATAWRTGPPMAGGGARLRQVSIEGAPWPTVDRVWAAWQEVIEAGGVNNDPRHSADGRADVAEVDGPPGTSSMRELPADHEPPLWIGFRSRPAIALYSTLLRLLTPAYLFRLWWRGKVEPMYRYRIGERLGFYGPGPCPSGWVWVHAVSLGETRAATALVEAMRQARPTLRLLLTHGTGTGREAGIGLLNDGDRQAWLPWDTPGATRRFLRRFRPSVGVLIETEVWPNLLLEARAHGVPMVLASARLSERSRRRGARFDVVMRPVAATVPLVLAQTDADADRLRSAGARRVEVAGNLKFDMEPDAGLLERGRAWAALGRRSIALAASTREGEEAMLLEPWIELQAPRPLLLIVPRHPQRFGEVHQMIESAGLSVARRSAWRDGPPPDEAFLLDVWLGDSMGEMPLYYGLGQVALLGGSFAPFGGQNLIEAAACGCPVVLGPHTYNFGEAAEHAIEAGAAIRVADMAHGVVKVCSLLADPGERSTASKNAQAFAALHRGAARHMAQRIFDLVDATAGDRGPSAA